MPGPANAGIAGMTFSVEAIVRQETSARVG